MKRFDKVITKAGAGGLLKAGLLATIIIVNGKNLFIRINGNSYHVKESEVVATN